ncbi:SAM-dependent methyltransferases [hydrothermal vent metagenome]|uniref:SAM-dependent methyltransferases n=1 Tax=hydrothermal vent metagenome TaxID=652676 RepID=A0A3B0SUM1_9ZZZZ
MDLKEENAISGDPSAHWYYISKGRAIKALLGRQPIEQLLDVGAGSGVFSKMLVDEGCAAKATCLDPNYADEFIGKRRTDKVAYVRNIDAVEADTVLMIDVLEHVDDDVELVRDYVRRAAPGTRFLISVPAFQFLWSSHDEFLERRRRYRLSDLRRTVEAAGLTPLRMRYFFGLLFPAAAVMRLAEKNNQDGAPASQLKSAPDWLNKSLIALHKLECAALFPLNQFAGVTAFCLAEKPAALAQDQKAA